MLNYAICEISGKQVKVIPNKPVEVDFLGDFGKSIDVLVLLVSENGQIKVGTPYLKDKFTLDYLDTVKGEKIRVAKFHAKANYRRVTGERVKKTRLVLNVKKAS